ncbi:hypothetical protein F441_19209 [Phytophthora nicotianae CJ01A1]|uniref:Uncharacterized protein n=5 Tax=Phytophthora nicotianae TaxID=4792 RepID=W2QXS5_PHYN3|nr:hypothetical protein PPTG_21684 [Phytophthora nicotianae INRA-310]ETI34031.1 hypothetical protein F443_19388 [Phytophthora nicotianae P1569]ETO62836.1 hypothetical protein F444_19337 [Phytophthora nicotianae P1976]ETP03919.1 hypothetical protein F441_19209 [Phytophthora nicotianae CJ01A1]ETP32073.1 hypothetical protein F442_19159 [Phytophthora nicotianae P10297]ETN17746.1 hypothetical protein PPTG_21684 [Phytophthora nicotianae INRA-310]
MRMRFSPSRDPWRHRVRTHAMLEASGTVYVCRASMARGAETVAAGVL